MEEVILKNFCGCSILVREEIAHGTDTEIDSESDDEIEGYVCWIWTYSSYSFEHYSLQTAVVLKYKSWSTSKKLLMQCFMEDTAVKYAIKRPWKMIQKFIVRIFLKMNAPNNSN